MGNTILEVKNLKKYFNVPAGALHAVDDVSFSIEEGKTLGIVGESGCGKSTTGRAILRLIEPTSGEIHFDGKDIMKLNASEMRKMRHAADFSGSVCIAESPYDNYGDYRGALDPFTYDTR